MDRIYIREKLEEVMSTLMQLPSEPSSTDSLRAICIIEDILEDVYREGASRTNEKLQQLTKMN